MEDLSTKIVTYSYDEAFNASYCYFNKNDLAAKTFLDKYALRDSDNRIIEKTPEQTHRRLAREFARIERTKFKNPLSEEIIFELLDGFQFIVPQGSPIYAIGNYDQYVSSSNCFVVDSPYDSYGGIMKTDEELAQISKRRGGVGVDISPLRPDKSPTKNSSRTSTGIIPYMSRYSNTIREVGQDGRRGAEMITCSIHHPESVIPWDDSVDGSPFNVHIKNESLGEYDVSSRYYNPNKIDFATAKYDARKVTGANISLRLTDEFLTKIDNNECYEQRWPVDSKNPSVSKKVKAKDVWDKIIYSAWRTAEPGILFWDTIIRESPADCYSQFGFATESTNPCGEIPLSPYDSCRLLAINLFGFVKNPFTKQASFDYEKFYNVAQIAQRLMDDLIDLEKECLVRIINKVKQDPEPDDIKDREIDLWNKILEACERGRRTGTGILALGDTLAAINVAYGSEEGIKEAEKIYQTLKFAAYRSSIDMAKELGAFPVWNHEIEKDNPFLNRFKDETLCISDNIIIEGKQIWDDMKRHGRRNIALLTTAPTGSISILSKIVNRFGTSSGIEPQYSIKPYIRKKKGNPNDVNFRSDSVDQNGDHWMHFKIYPAAVQDWMEITGESDESKSPWHRNTAEELDWTLRVRLQAACQKHIDHSISSTVNLPNDVTVEKVAEIYKTAWLSGCKGITVYRDGCRTGVLVKEEDKKADKLFKTDAVKRPRTLSCDVHHIKVKGDDFFVLVGMLSGEPYEIFAGRNGMIDRKIKHGEITKIKRGHYEASFEDGSVLTNVCDHITDDQAAIARLASLALRHGADIQHCVASLEKVPGDMTSLARSMARALKKYIKDGVIITGEECTECGSKLTYSEGCAKCGNCGWSRCK